MQMMLLLRWLFVLFVLLWLTLASSTIVSFPSKLYDLEPNDPLYTSVLLQNLISILLHGFEHEFDYTTNWHLCD